MQQIKYRLQICWLDLLETIAVVVSSPISIDAEFRAALLRVMLYRKVLPFVDDIVVDAALALNVINCLNL